MPAVKRNKKKTGRKQPRPRTSGMGLGTRTSWRSRSGKLTPKTVRATSRGLTATQVRAEVKALRGSSEIKQVAKDLGRVVVIGKVVSRGRVDRVTWSPASASRFISGFVPIAKVRSRARKRPARK